LWIFSDLIFEEKNLVTFIIVLLGFYLHNKVVESRKKIFRLLFSILYQFIFWWWLKKQKNTLGRVS